MMHSPPHPGQSIVVLCLEPAGLTVTKAAAHLGISRKHLSAVVNGRAGVSPDLAIRLTKLFGGQAEIWLKMQMQHDLWKAERHSASIRVRPLVDAA